MKHLGVSPVQSLVLRHRALGFDNTYFASGTQILEEDITLNCKPDRRTQAACQGYRQSDLPLLFPFVGSRKTLSQASKRSHPQGLLETNMLGDEYLLGSCVRTNKSLS